MELFFILLVCILLIGVTAFTLKRRYAHQLLSEQNKSSSLAIIESQLKQKNQKLSDELGEKKIEADRLLARVESLTKDLEVRIKEEQQIRTTAEHLSKQLAVETSQRSVLQEQVGKTHDHATATTSQLQATIEEQLTKLRQLQQHLHDAQIAHTMTEGIFSRKESEYRQKISELSAVVSSLKNDVFSSKEGWNNEFSARQIIERDKTKVEQELIDKSMRLETDLSALQTEYQKLDEAFQEEQRVRLATEHALQESKEKLYAVIRELEKQVKEHEITISRQSSELHIAETHIGNLKRALNNVLQDSPLPAFVINQHGICSFFNASLQTMIGYSDEEITNRHFSILFPQNERAFYEEQWNSASDRAEQFKGETNISTSAGDVIPADINIVEIMTDTEKAFVGFIFDKTHEFNAAQHYRDAKKREEELIKLKSQFIAMVTNQLRASLVTVATNTELLERFMFKWSEEKRYHAFYRINDSLKQMMDLLRDVESATSSAVNYVPAIKEVNLERLAQTIAKEVANDLGTNHRFILSEEGNISSMKIDEKIVQTVLSHTLSNAFKFSPDDSDVKLHIQNIDSLCTFIIEDHGIGIPNTEQHHLFTSFFRGSNIGNIQGTGLGLTVVQQYVQLAGGAVTIDSQVDKGTKVTISLPVQ